MTIEAGSLRERARSLIDQVDAAPLETLEEATVLLERLGADDDAEARSMLERVRGTSRRLLGELGAAEQHLHAAVDHAVRGGSSLLEGEARMSLGVVLAFLGRADEAMESFDVAETLLDGLAAARVVFQRSSILYRQGEYADALDLMNRALPHFEAAGDIRHIAHTRSNRGVVLGYAGRLHEAREDLERADALYRSVGLQSAAAVSTHNLGWVAGRLGELAPALELFDKAADELALLGRPHPELAIDRCEVLIAAGCYEEAVPIAVGAAAALRDGGNTLEGAEALLMTASTLLWCGDAVRAEEAALGAMRLFAENGRPVWAASAEAIAYDAGWKVGRLGADDLPRVEATARQLEFDGLHLASREAFLLAGRLALAHDRVDVGERLLGLVADARREGPIGMRVQAWLSLALLRLAQGNVSGASRAATSGANALAEAQSSLGALELRATMAGHGEGLFEIGTELALRSGQATRVFDWAERSRAGSLRFPAVLPPDDAASAEDLTRLRLAAIEVRDLEASGQSSAVAQRELKRREDEVVRRNRRSARSGGRQGEIELCSAPAVRAALGGRTLVEFVVHRGTRYALRLDSRNCRLIPLGEAKAHLAAAERLQRRLRRLAVRAGRSSAALESAVASSTAELVEMLLDPVTAGDDVVIVPGADLSAVPWGLLRDRPATQFAVCPSASMWVAASSRPVADRLRGSVVVVSAPDVDPDGREVDSVVGNYSNAVVLGGDNATAVGVLEAMDGADVVHLISHGSAGRRNPLFGSLGMVDGPLYAYDLQRVRRLPKLIVLSCCNVGASVRMSPSESLGMASVLLAGGTRNVVATSSLLPDTIDTAEAMGRFHQRFAAGESVRSSLAAASTDARLFSLECFGAG